MAAAIPFIIAAVAGAGISQLISGFGSAPQGGPDPAALPNQDKAKMDAGNTVANQRQILLASGGQTDYTGGTGVLTGSDVSKTTLLGG